LITFFLLASKEARKESNSISLPLIANHKFIGKKKNHTIVQNPYKASNHILSQINYRRGISINSFGRLFLEDPPNSNTALACSCTIVVETSTSVSFSSHSFSFKSKQSSQVLMKMTKPRRLLPPMLKIRFRYYKGRRRIATRRA